MSCTNANYIFKNEFHYLNLGFFVNVFL